MSNEGQFRLKMYNVKVKGFPVSAFPAATPSKARAEAWRQYTHAYDVSFREFLKVSTIARIDPPPRFGEEITVSGERAFLVTGYPGGQYVAFARPNSDQILLSHPLDVSALAGDAA
ncbi:hypothetical protein [Mesorhizobium ciceri]|uniref:hypothetical protein n=1 Tax=Mesorhizobium TaxID=68287 RepID=UPI00047C72EB|nr:hypothetical protein [Mesorhizobium ciceri]